MIDEIVKEKINLLADPDVSDDDKDKELSKDSHQRAIELLSRKVKTVKRVL